MQKTLRPSVIRSSEWYKRIERDEQQWRQTRFQVLQRDNWTCVYCGFRAKKFLMVNHIGSEDNHQLENLETVCKPCHSVLHMGINSLNGVLTVIESDANQADIVRQTRRLVHLSMPWSTIEKKILEQFSKPQGKVFNQEESIMWANKMLASIPIGEYRGYLPDGMAVVFHEEGPWEQFPEAVHKWGNFSF